MQLTGGENFCLATKAVKNLKINKSRRETRTLIARQLRQTASVIILHSTHTPYITFTRFYIGIRIKSHTHTLSFDARFKTLILRLLWGGNFAKVHMAWNDGMLPLAMKYRGDRRLPHTHTHTWKIHNLCGRFYNFFCRCLYIGGKSALENNYVYVCIFLFPAQKWNRSHTSFFLVLVCEKRKIRLVNLKIWKLMISGTPGSTGRHGAQWVSVVRNLLRNGCGIRLRCLGCSHSQTISTVPCIQTISLPGSTFRSWWVYECTWQKKKMGGKKEAEL